MRPIQFLFSSFEERGQGRAVRFCFQFLLTLIHKTQRIRPINSVLHDTSPILSPERTKGDSPGQRRVTEPPPWVNKKELLSTFEW